MMLMIAQSGSSQLLWNCDASSPIGVTCIWMPLRPSGSPMPGVGIMWPTVPGTTAGCAASGLSGFCAVPAGGVAVLGCAAAIIAAWSWVGWAAAVWAGAGELAGACAAAAGVSPAAARAIAHPINLIFTPVGMLFGTQDADAPSLIWPLY